MEILLDGKSLEKKEARWRNCDCGLYYAVYSVRGMTEWLHIRFNKTTSRSDAALVDETEIRARPRSWMLEIQAHVGLVRTYVLRSPGSNADSSRCAKSASLYES